MKRRTKLIIGLITASLGCCVMAACSTDDSPYGEMNMPTVHYDSNGGQFLGSSFVTITDAYPLEQAQAGVKLVEPGDAIRGDKGAPISSVSRSGYFLAGWYQTRDLRVDGNGNPLDEDGNLCSVSGKEQGYIYSDRWDFEEDVWTVKSDWQYAQGEYDLTLYAAWIPNFSYEFYEETENGWKLYGAYSFNPNNTPEDKEIPIPSLDEEGVSMQYSETFPQSSGKTFVAAYTDEEKGQEVKTYTHDGYVDEEKGVAVNRVVKCYTTWKAGVWFNIYTAKQFYDNSQLNGCYDIKADLDFQTDSETDSVGWSLALASSTFTGQIIGNGHKFTNIKVQQSNASQNYGGLFGRIADEVVIKDATFENVTYILGAGSRLNPSNFGLFAGFLATGATVENVTVTGTLQIGNIYRTADYATYNIGELIGNSTSRQVKGITHTVAVERYEEAFENTVTVLDFTVDETTGQVGITVRDK